MLLKKIGIIIFIFLPLTPFAAEDALYLYRMGQYDQASNGLNELAKKKDKVALFYLGQMYITGYGKIRNLDHGIQLITKSAELNYLPAQMFLGKYYLQKEHDVAEALRWFKKAADRNDEDAQIFVAGAYKFGYGVKSNPATARHYIIAAAKNGNAVAQYELAQHFFNTRYKSNHKLGVIWLKKSAAQNNAEAEYELGKLYLQGKHVEKDLLKAKELFEKSAQRDNSNAQLALGLIYMNKDANYDAKRGFALVAKAAASGNLEAQKELIKLYEEGVGTEKNPALAMQLKTKLENANKQENDAKVSDEEKLAKARKEVMLWMSQGKISQNNIPAYQLSGGPFVWQNQSILKNDNIIAGPKMDAIKKSDIFRFNMAITEPNSIPISKFLDIIGSLYYQEKQVKLFIPHYHLPKMDNYKSLYKQLSRSADYGYAPAQFELGLMYEYGLGMQVDMEKAMYWYQKALERNDQKAEYTMGLLYLKGKGVEKNYAMALHWLQKAAFKGNANAQYLLGLIYENGLGQQGSDNNIKKNIKEAEMMYNLAVSNNHPVAQLNLGDMYASGLLKQSNTLKQYRENQKLLLELYENAARQGVTDAKLPLAFYYAENKKQQKWAFDTANDLAKKGNKFAEFLLALMYDRGLGVSQDKSNAIDWYQEVLKTNNPLAAFIMGTYYFTGEGVSKDLALSMKLLKQSVENNIPYANYNLAAIQYQHNPNDDSFLSYLQRASEQKYIKASLQMADYYLTRATDNEQLKKAAEIYENEAKKGYAEPQLKLGYMYENEIYFKKDFKESQAWYEQAAATNKIAQYLLGNMYQLGKLGEVNYEEAQKWYEKSANNGFIPAMVALGFLYENEKDDYAKAQIWYQKAAEANNPQAQFNLGLMYEYGKGMKPDATKAQEWYSKAAKQGYAPAEFNLANLYLYGNGIRPDNEKAYTLLAKVAKQGNTNAIYELGLLNEAGVGTEINIFKALNYYKEASDKGNVKAQLALARIYNFGMSVPIDYSVVFKLYEKAAENGSAYAQYQMAKMYQNGKGIKKDLNKANDLFKTSKYYEQEKEKIQLPKLAELIDIKFLNNTPNYKIPLQSQNVAQTKLEVSSIGNTPNFIYMYAINKLNEGELEQSTNLLKFIMQQFPKFDPAKRIYNTLSAG